MKNNRVGKTEKSETLNQKQNRLKTSVVSFLLHTKNSITVAECKKLLHLSLPRGRTLVQELCSEKILVANGKSSNKGGGRLAITYSLIPDSKIFLGVEIKPDKTTIGAINLEKKWVGNLFNADFVYDKEDAQLGSKIVLNLKAFIKANAIAQENIAGLSIILPGLINPTSPSNKTVLSVSPIDSIKELVEKELSVPVFLDNITRAIAMGEVSAFPDLKNSHLIYIQLDWGLGLSIIVNGKPYYGQNGFAGEVGHIPYFNNNVLCYCGKQGCFETEVSGYALLRKVNERLTNKQSSQLSALQKSNSPLSIQDAINACVNGDTMTIDIVEEMGEHLGKMIVLLLNLFNPQTVVIGGRLSMCKDSLLLPIKKTVKKFALHAFQDKTEIIFSNEADKQESVFGACLLAMESALLKSDVK